MYKQIYNIGDFTERPLIEIWTYTQDAGGGTIKTLDSSYERWALITLTQGSFSNEYGKYNHKYGMKMVTRYDANLAGSCTVVYDNARWLITSVVQSDRFTEAVLEKIDNQLVTGTIIPPMAKSYVYNYTATGGELTFTDASLIGKTIFGIYRDGLAKKLLTSGTPAADEVVFNSTTGNFLFSQPFYSSEKVIIQYF